MRYNTHTYYMFVVLMSTKYSKEFKEEVVKMYLSGIRPVDIVKTKNIKRLNIYEWVQAFKNSTLDIHGNKKYGNELDKFITDRFLNNPKTSVRDICKEWKSIHLSTLSTLTVRKKLEKLGFKYCKISKTWKTT